MAPKDITLYFSVGSCSGATYMALTTAGVPFKTVKVDLKTHTLADGSDYYKINPKGAVPALMVDGELLTENTAVLSLVADLNPAANLGGGEHGTMERYHGMEALAWVGSELHKTFGPLFNPTFPEEGKTLAKERLHKHFKMMDSLFAGQKWLTKNADPTVADYYANVCLSWCGFVGLDISEYKNIATYTANFKAIPTVASGMAEWLAGGKQ